MKACVYYSLFALLPIVIPLLFSLFALNRAYAQMAVADAGLFAQAKLQYIEAVNTVSELRENIKQTKAMILETSKIKEGIAAMRTEMSTIYNNTFGLIGELERLRMEISKTPDDIQSFLDEFKRNADCLFDDMEKYQQVDTIYKARYVFKDEYGGTPNYEADDPYIWESGTEMAGAFDPVQLTENPCGHTVTYYSELVKNIEQEQTVLKRIYSTWNKTEAEIEQTQTFYKEIQKKVEKTETEKETLDTMKTILWKMNGHLESIDRTLLDFTGLIITKFHDPTALLNTPGLTDSAKTMLSVNNVKLGKSTEFDKKATIWKSLEKASKKTVIR